MAPHDGDDDPAVYRSGSSKQKKSVENGKTEKANQIGKNADEANRVDGEDDGEDDDEDDEDDEDEDDTTLLTVQPSFNRLLLALRDQGTLHFVKYVSSAAQGSRWDVCGEMNTGMMVIEKMDEDEDGDGDIEDA